MLEFKFIWLINVWYEKGINQWNVQCHCMQCKKYSRNLGL